MYRIDALLAEGFTRREIRRFVEKGILPHASGRGTSAYYSDAHLLILRRIRRARESHRSLHEIAEEVRLAHPALFRGERGLGAHDHPMSPDATRQRRMRYAVNGG